MGPTSWADYTQCSSQSRWPGAESLQSLHLPLQSHGADLGLQGRCRATLSHTEGIRVWYGEAHIVCHCGSVLKEQQSPTMHWAGTWEQEVD